VKVSSVNQRPSSYGQSCRSGNGEPEMPGQKRRLSILLIDDNAIVRAAIGEMLEEEGWRVTYCTDGKSAVETSCKSSFDAILVDFGMPGLNGLDVVTILRPAHRDALIIGMSLDDRCDEFLAAGADAFLIKPFHIDELLRLLNIPGSAAQGGGTVHM
jgi:two-component system response regulator QseB